MKTPTDDDAKRIGERAAALVEQARQFRAEFEAMYPKGQSVRHKLTGRLYLIVGHYHEAALVQLAPHGERGSKVSQPYVSVEHIAFAETPGAPSQF